MIVNNKEEANIYPTSEEINSVYGQLYSSSSPADDELITDYKPSGRTFYPVSLNDINSELKMMKAKKFRILPQR